MFALASTLVLISGAAGAAGIGLLFRRRDRAIRAFWNLDRKLLDEVYLSALPFQISTGTNTLQDQEHAENVRNMEIQASTVYQPLDDTRIQTRLVRLEYTSQRDDNIVCSLVPVEVGKSEPYIALSYEWGPISNPKIVFLNGVPVGVTQNLFKALQELRSRKMLLIWVDALSIDQSDKTEIGRNFQKMPLIFNRAQSVFAWLGETSSSFHELKHMVDQLLGFRSRPDFHIRLSTGGLALNDLLCMWMEKPIGSKPIRPLLADYPKIKAMIRKIAPKLGDEDHALRMEQLNFLKLISILVNNSFWRRAWILEELSVGSEISLTYGEESLDFDILCGFIQELQRLAANNLFQGFRTNHQHVYNIIALRQKYQMREPIHLLTALQRSFGTIATRDHDKVYSLVGIAFDSTRFVTDVDTKLPLHVITRRMTETSIHTTKMLDIICLQDRYARHTNELPSWAPDWPSIGGDRFNDRLVRYLTGQDDIPKRHLRSNYWRASSDSRWKTHDFLNDGRTLKVQGLRLGLIHDLSGAIGEDVISDPLYCQSNKKSKPGGMRYEMDLFRALTIYKKEHPVNDKGSHFGDLWGSRTTTRLKEKEPACHAWLDKHRKFVLHGRALDSLGGGDHSESDLTDQAGHKASRILYSLIAEDDPTDPSDLQALEENHLLREMNYRVDALANAVVRVLKDGRRLMGGLWEPLIYEQVKKPYQLYGHQHGFTGWTHPEARPSDEVYLLKGCSVPIILRPAAPGESVHGPAFRVVGDAHVINVMHGEAWLASEDNLTDMYLV